MEVLLDWITTGTNYAKWRGDAEGITKETLCGEILALMRNAGLEHRNKTDIRGKLAELQASYNKARDWSENTGEGIRAAGGENAEATIKGNLFKLIPWVITKKITCK